ncbi:MaoC/PaaZ C-terminal domain-containing protein [Arenibaculum sp.]|uniref:MaoC/PaaZ C-terminal domain-containing protein n=1 Tax=Arenibaculum sp. TaxID=2865862 RepID=UPI002E0DEE28|nr:MaoC/PaaZ C-terminal domain-containing protein [Arenibaculum sp.]
MEEVEAAGLAVGTVVETRTETLGRDDIVAFARQFDPQPMHLDEDAARGTVFGGLVASGWHVAAVTMRLMVEARPLGAAPVVGVEVERLRYRRPVPPGTRLRCRGTIDAVAPALRPGQSYVTMSVDTLDADTGSVLISQRWKLLAYRGEEG